MTKHYKTLSNTLNYFTQLLQDFTQLLQRFPNLYKTLNNNQKLQKYTQIENFVWKKITVQITGMFYFSFLQEVRKFSKIGSFHEFFLSKKRTFTRVPPCQRRIRTKLGYNM
jgi:hypothetical protein